MTCAQPPAQTAKARVYCLPVHLDGSVSYDEGLILSRAVGMAPHICTAAFCATMLGPAWSKRPMYIDGNSHIACRKERPQISMQQM